MSSEILDTLRLTIGPLHYELVAHDNWGVEALAQLAANMTCTEYAGSSTRIFHLGYIEMTVEENIQLNQDKLPDRFASLLFDAVPRDGWKMCGDEIGCWTFWHDQIQQGLIVIGAIPNTYKARFYFPWPAMLYDIIRRGGGIFHGGLIERGDKYYIITAPPGGGKTTAIGRLPIEWQVFADDACLIWPDRNGKFWASPLPTWSVIISRSQPLPAIGLVQIGLTMPVSGIIILNKEKQDRLLLLDHSEILLPIFQALCEHPRVVQEQYHSRTELFDIAHKIVNACPSWQLDITLDGDFWNLLTFHENG